MELVPLDSLLRIFMFLIWRNQGPDGTGKHLYDANVLFDLMGHLLGQCWVVFKSGCPRTWTWPTLWACHGACWAEVSSWSWRKWWSVENIDYNWDFLLLNMYEIVIWLNYYRTTSTGRCMGFRYSFKAIWMEAPRAWGWRSTPVHVWWRVLFLHLVGFKFP